MTRLDWALLLSDTTVRGLDTWSTRRALTSCTCNKEAELPGWIANHTATDAAYSAGAVLTVWTVSRRIERKHPKLAHALTLLDIGGVGIAVAHNVTLFKPPATERKLGQP